MNSTTKGTVLEALNRMRGSLYRDAIFYNYQDEVDRIDAAIADLDGATWEPVDEFQSIACVSGARCSIMVERDEDRLTMYSNHAPPVSVELPDDIRLCRRTTAQQQQPDSEATGIRAANVASGIAMAKLREVHESGQDIKIPSLGIVIPGKQNESEATP